MYSLINLPYEVLSYVIGYLTLQDVYCLARTSSNFRFLLDEERICKFILQTKLQYSNEALEAVRGGGGNARHLRRVLKRHDALATASPFVVATIAFCDSYLYSKGVLCYTLGEKIRVLNLHHCGHIELVISIPALLSHALRSSIGDNSNGHFRMLYYSDQILSCVYTSTDLDLTAWLIAFNLKTKHILVVRELESTDKLFVRHNKQYLYYGTHSELGTDGYKKWVISGYCFTDSKWFEQKVHLPDMVGSEIGSTICFELYDGFFYGISNQTSFEVEEIDWTSFYHCFRFPLDSPCRDTLEKTNDESMWRRQHQEGPIDDRWTQLRLFEDESLGELKIVEARKEWYLGSSKSQRTYYTTNLVFPEPSIDEPDDSQAGYSSDLGSQAFAIPSWLPDSADTESENHRPQASATSSSNLSGSSGADPVPGSSHRTTSGASGMPKPQYFPDKQLGILVDKHDHPNYIAAPNRRPENTHPGNDGSAQPTITLAKCRVRTYNPSCSTFLDLVDDPHTDDWQGKQRLRLRAGTRTLGPILRDDTGLLREPSPDLRTALHEMYVVPSITYWPPAQSFDNPDEQLDCIYRLMNPPSHMGNIEGTADERSMVYVTGSHNEPKALIFIGFDPALQLRGLKKWDCTSQWGMKGVGEGPHVDGRASGPECESSRAISGDGLIDVGEEDRILSIDRKGKGKAGLDATPIQHISTDHASIHFQSSSAAPHAQSKARAGRWWRKEPAMYQDINIGYYFGLDKKGKQ